MTRRIRICGTGHPNPYDTWRVGRPVGCGGSGECRSRWRRTRGCRRTSARRSRSCSSASPTPRSSASGSASAASAGPAAGPWSTDVRRRHTRTSCSCREGSAAPGRPRTRRFARWLRTCRPALPMAGGEFDGHGHRRRRRPARPPRCGHALARRRLLGQYGSAASTDRIVEIGNVITCEGEITAMHVALLVTLRLFGPSEVARVRAELDRYGRAGEGTASGRWWRRRPRRPTGPQRPRNPELVAPDVIEFEPLRIHPR